MHQYYHIIRGHQEPVGGERNPASVLGQVDYEDNDPPAIAAFLRLDTICDRQLGEFHGIT